MRFGHLALLLLANLIWAANPSAAKILVKEVGPLSAGWAKYFGAFVCLSFSLWLSKRFFPKLQVVLGFESSSSQSLVKLERKELLYIFIIGLTTCFLSPLLQMQGLEASSAANNAILVAMEPSLVIILGFLLFRTLATQKELVALVLATIGFFEFVNFRQLFWPNSDALSAGSVVWATGDLLILGAITCEACYSVFSKPILGRISATKIYYYALSLGFTLLSLVLLFKGHVPRLDLLSYRGWGAFFWIGPLGTVITYLIWIRLLEIGVPLSAMVVSLFLQPLFGVFVGVMVHGETLNKNHFFGGALILAALILGSLQVPKQGR